MTWCCLLRPLFTNEVLNADSFILCPVIFSIAARLIFFYDVHKLHIGSTCIILHYCTKCIHHDGYSRRDPIPKTTNKGSSKKIPGAFRKAISPDKICRRGSVRATVICYVAYSSITPRYLCTTSCSIQLIFSLTIRKQSEEMGERFQLHVGVF